MNVASHSVVRALGRGLTLLGSAAAHAQAYPNKPITIITAFGPGSASDTITRVVAQPLGVALKQSVIVEARPGANGAHLGDVRRAQPRRRLHAVDDAPTRRTPPRRS